MIAADASTYNKINKTNQVAYLSCDEEDDDSSFIGPDKMLNDLMAVKPKAIVLYSTSKNWCSLNYDDTLDYTSILSMVDSAEALQALYHLNGTDNGTLVKATISGSTDDKDDDSGTGTTKGKGSNSAVAMSILYSITGLITMLFLIIIATGAVRAHRYPERYGPRRAFGGRPRQSRAKGLARAVLDTIPIVKFGNQPPTKPDPEMELETATTDGQENTAQRAVSNLSEDRSPGTPGASGETGVTSVPAATGADADGGSTSRRASHAVESVDRVEDEHLGCSICTEDFKVGEDVRVLPCKHQFHPACIDPWLINVSGTCPLW